MFSITLSAPEQNLGSARAEIVVGNHKETAEVPLHYWSRDQYRAQWREAITKIVAGQQKACLITGMHDPRSANFLDWWLMWREGSTVFIQNQILFMDEIRSNFNENDLERHIPERKTVTDEGEKISEWTVRVQDIRVPD